MPNTPNTQKDYSLENQAGKQLETKIEMLFQQRFVMSNGDMSVHAKDEIRVLDLQIQNLLLDLSILKNLFPKEIRNIFYQQKPAELELIKKHIGFGYCIFESYNKTKKKCNPEKGRFMQYFTVTFISRIHKEASIYKQDMRHGVKWADKKKLSVVSLDVPFNDDENQTLGETLSSPEQNYVDVEEENAAVHKLFAKIDTLYKETKAGQKNKSIAYTYKVLDYLLSLSKENAEQFIAKYDFLKPQKNNILHFFQEEKSVIKHVSQKIYSQLCNADNVIICRTCTELVKRLKALEEQDSKN